MIYKCLLTIDGSYKQTGGDTVILNGSKYTSIKGTMESYKSLSSVTCWTEVYICNKYNKYITTELM